MSRLDELIADLCTDGVEYKELQDILTIKNGSDYKGFPDGDVPVYGSGGIMAYVDRFAYDKPSVLIPRKGSIDKLYYVETPFWNVDTIFYTVIKTEIVFPRYVYHCLLKEHLEKLNTAGGVPSLTQKVLNRVKIPVPPLEVQREIARILDSFTELTAELTAELEMRIQQFKEYSALLFDDIRRGTKATALVDFCTIEKGKTPIQKAIPGKYPLVVTTSERKTSAEYQFNSPAVCIPLVSSRGHGVASLNHVYYQEGCFALGNILCAVMPKNQSQLTAKYLYYYFEQTKDYTIVPLMKGGANVALRIDDLSKVKVHLPAVERQHIIVNILQKFEEYCADVLPAEIVARQKQYEYYRDKLLTFKEKGA